MTPGSTTTEWQIVRWVFGLFVGILVFMFGFVCWGYASDDLEWQAAMDSLISVMKFLFVPVIPGVTYILKRGGLKIADKLTEDNLSAEDLVRAVASEQKSGELR